MKTSITSETVSISEAIKVLHPRLRKSIVQNNQERQRFSRLLLEHGEHHLQDWAAAVSSFPDSSTDSLNSGKSSKYGGSIVDKSSSRDNFRKNGGNSRNDNPLPPSVNMGRIEGRLHLCSRSIVFEPSEYSRGIIRCAFERMDDIPVSSEPSKAFSPRNPGHVISNGRTASKTSSSLSGMRDGNELKKLVLLRCKRHSIMKTNNVIAPFEAVEIPTVFQFTFLHSSHDRFLELARTIFNMVNHNGNDSFPTLDNLLKPMLDRPFDPFSFVDVREKPLTNNLRCYLVMPLMSNPGCSIVTSNRVYFQPADGIVSAVAIKAQNWALDDVVATARRYSGLKDCALEIYFQQGYSVLLSFESILEREQVMRLLPANVPCHTDRDFAMRAFHAWQKDEISNFDYLLAINSAAGRSLHDLSRYPVFPWVISDYKSEELDLKSHATFRDLKKPIGALSEERLRYFCERLDGMSDLDDQFLYGTHYSAPGYVLYYMIRCMPEHMLCLQNGKFDAPDRIFYSVNNCFASALENHADVKELIPQFYFDDQDFLINAQCLQLGSTQNGDRVNDVKLPPWAKSPRDFLRKNRKALESEICTEMLPRWIDLIFGFKSRGEEAKKSDNLFHPMSYMNSSDLKNMKSEEEQARAELQATEFGIVPDLLFCASHPSKNDDVHFDRFVAPDSDRSHVDISFNDELAEDSRKSNGFSPGEQPWELLESPSKLSNNTINNTVRDRKWSTESTNSGKLPSTELHDISTVKKPAKRSVNFGGVPFPETNKYSDKDDLLSQNDRSKEDTRVNGAVSSLSKNSQKEQNSHNFNANKNVERQISSSFSDNFSQNDKKKVNGGILSGSGTSFIKKSPKNTKDKFSFESPDTYFEKNDSSRDNIEISESGNPAYNTVSSSHKTPLQRGWELKLMATKMIHGDSISGCNLLLNGGNQNKPYLTTASLDGSLMVHEIQTVAENNDNQGNVRRSFIGAKASTLNYLRKGTKGRSPSTTTKLESFRSHTSTDPLACLAVTSDNHGGHIVFSGGHDDVVLAYGISSACAVASVYSHRDAVTGLALIQQSSASNAPSEMSGTSRTSTHLMISGSWDATVKVWSVALSAGETVSINREPLAEFYDADSSIVCVSVTQIDHLGIVICAGCADGSFVVWLFRGDHGKEVLHKEAAKRGGGPCSTSKWTKSKSGNIILVAGFATGRLASYILIEDTLKAQSELSLGSPVRCLSIEEDMLFAGCADGGLRAVIMEDNAELDPSPYLWKAVNGSHSPGLSSVCHAILQTKEGKDVVIVTGADDGSVALFDLKYRNFST